MSREFIVLGDDGTNNVWFFIEDARVAKVEIEELPEWEETGHIESDRSYSIKDLLRAVERQNKFYVRPVTAIFDSDLQRQFDWAEETFGPGTRLDGILDHIQKEILEIKAKPDDLEEWIDLLHLVLDGARRNAHADPDMIIQAYLDKLEVNINREWPDWRTAEPGKAIEHIRE